MDAAAEDLLPVELWTKILKYLKLSNLITIQEVCLLFWNIVQALVARGHLKTDHYVIIKLFS